ncbi:MAG: hypothetical protein GF334_09835 [Candidatus Altiarchaeales archaeon]|nr:hypothetical protein [Candidatus Altiarchaeales archaeon]
MYAKFLIYGDECDQHNIELRGVSNKEGNKAKLVVPYVCHVFEGKRMSYKKYSVSGKDEYYAITRPLTIHCVLSDMDITQEFEFIVLSIYAEDGTPESYISAADAILYIMNDNGKTIDKLACRNNH